MRPRRCPRGRGTPRPAVAPAPAHRAARRVPGHGLPCDGKAAGTEPRCVLIGVNAGCFAATVLKDEDARSKWRRGSAQRGLRRYDHQGRQPPRNPFVPFALRVFAFLRVFVVQTPRVFAFLRVFVLQTPAVHAPTVVAFLIPQPRRLYRGKPTRNAMRFISTNRSGTRASSSWSHSSSPGPPGPTAPTTRRAAPRWPPSLPACGDPRGVDDSRRGRSPVPPPTAAGRLRDTADRL